MEKFDFLLPACITAGPTFQILGFIHLIVFIQRKRAINLYFGIGSFVAGSLMVTFALCSFFEKLYAVK